MSKQESSQDNREEDDLDDLDDLLDDFAGEVLSKPPGSANPSTVNHDDKHASASDNGSLGNKPIVTDASAGKAGQQPINDEFKDKLEDLIKDLNIQDPDTKNQFEQLVKNFEEENQQLPKESKNFDNVMKDTMERLKNSGKNIDEQIKHDQASVNPEDMLSQLLSGLGGDGDKDLDMSKLLVDMLEQLSSKEVLYEPIKDLNTKFPDYLKDKKGKISDDEYNNYSKQYDITNDIIEIFESPNYNDDDKQQRDQVNSLLESLQELGQPPTELVGDNADFPGFGGGSGGLGGMPGLGGLGNDLGFSDKDLPKDFEKDLEEGCQQQ